MICSTTNFNRIFLKNPIIWCCFTSIKQDVTTNAIMPHAKLGHVDLICKQDGIICGLEVFKRTFKLLDSNSKFSKSILLIVSFITPAARFANTKLSNKELLAKRLAP